MSRAASHLTRYQYNKAKTDLRCVRPREGSPGFRSSFWQLIVKTRRVGRFLVTFQTLPVGAEQRHQMWRDALAEIVDVGFTHDPLLDEAETEIKQTGALVIRGDVEP